MRCQNKAEEENKWECSFFDYAFTTCGLPVELTKPLGRCGRQMPINAMYRTEKNHISGKCNGMEISEYRFYWRTLWYKTGNLAKKRISIHALCTVRRMIAKSSRHSVQNAPVTQVGTTVWHLYSFHIQPSGILVLMKVHSISRLVEKKKTIVQRSFSSHKIQTWNKKAVSNSLGYYHEF